MISCDQCGGWFHGDCVDITEQAGQSMEEAKTPYVCPKCQESGVYMKCKLTHQH